MNGTTLLDYAVNTTPDPIQASPSTGNPNTVTLEIVVSNSSGDMITCNSIAVSFLTGTDAEELSSDTSGIGNTVPTGWSMQQSGSIFTFSPDTEEAGQISGQGLTFVLSNIKVNQQPGTFQLTITEDASDPDAIPPAPEENRTINIPLSKFPPQFYVDDPTTNHSIINKGDSVLLSWSGSSSSGNYTATYSIEYENGDGNKVTISHPKGQPTQPLPAVGSYEIDDAGLDPTVFYLQVTVQVQGLDHPLYYTKSASVTVIQPKPAINSFSIAPNSVVPGQGLSFTLSWTVSNVTDFQIIANDGPGGQSRRLDVPFSLEGTYVVYPIQLQTTYSMQLLSSSRNESEEI